MEDRIRDAYEQMTPTPEQEERMLAALLAAQNDTAAEQAVNNPARKRRGFTAWKIAAPVAACLVVGAIAFGMGTMGAIRETPAVEQPKDAQVTQTDSDAETNGGASAVEAQDQMADMYVAETEAGLGTTADEWFVDEPFPPMPDDPFNTEEYSAVDESGFVSTAAQPLSTVSADVDTASYANLRRMINDGCGLDEIPSGAVRIEEMLNYFTYDYEKPAGADLFNVQAEIAQCPWNPDTQLLMLGFATPYETGVAEKGANLVFLIDVSGSMGASDKLDLLKDSFASLVGRLDENDVVSIVTYSGKEEVVLEGAAGDDVASIMRAVYKLQAGGSTNGEAGLRMAYDVAERNFIEGGVNRIVMASDGDLNVGMTSESDLYDFVEQKRETGVYLSVLGFGTGNYKDNKMEVLADHGNGSYHYIDCIEEADRVLSQKLMANLVPFADDVKLQVEFNPAQVKGYRLIGYENRTLAAEDFLDDAIDAGDVGPNAQFTVAYEIVPTDSAIEIAVPDLKYGASQATNTQSHEWLTCSLRYCAFADGAVHEQQLAVDASDVSTHPSSDWSFAAAVIEFGMLANGSSHAGTTTVDGLLEHLSAMNLAGERAGFEELVQKAAANTD